MKTLFALCAALVLAAGVVWAVSGSKAPGGAAPVETVPAAAACPNGCCPGSCCDGGPCPNGCCPGACCGANSVRADEGYTCPLTGEKLSCPGCCPLSSGK